MLFRRPLHEIALWPAAELELIRAYLLKKPTAEDRIEIALARLSAIYVNAHIKPGAKAAETVDFLSYRDPWARASAGETEFQTANKGWLQAFKNLSTRIRK